MTLEVTSSAKPLPSKKKRWSRDKIYTNLAYLVMVLPGAIWLFLFAYLPMPGMATQ
jgi:ABC-type polysaccharide transport system permease subunit